MQKQGCCLVSGRLTALCARSPAISALAIASHCTLARQPLKCRWRWWLSRLRRSPLGEEHLQCGLRSPISRLPCRASTIEAQQAAASRLSRDGHGRRQAVAIIDRFMATCSRLKCILGKTRNRHRSPSIVSADSKEAGGCIIARLSLQLSVDYCVWPVTPGLLISGVLVK